MKFATVKSIETSIARGELVTVQTPDGYDYILNPQPTTTLADGTTRPTVDLKTFTAVGTWDLCDYFGMPPSWEVLDLSKCKVIVKEHPKPYLPPFRVESGDSSLLYAHFFGSR